MRRSLYSRPTATSDGLTNVNIAICIVFFAFTVLICAMFFIQLNKKDEILHQSETDAAYRYTEMKSQRDQLKVICDSNAVTQATLLKWMEQNNPKLKPPPEYTTQKPCAVIKNTEKEEK